MNGTPRTTLTIDELCAANDQLEDDKTELKLKVEKLEGELEQVRRALMNLRRVAWLAKSQADKLAQDLTNELQ